MNFSYKTSEKKDINSLEAPFRVIMMLETLQNIRAFHGKVWKYELLIPVGDPTIHPKFMVDILL